MTPGRILPLAFAGFIALGMPKAAESIAWPSMADDLDQRLGALGWLVATHIVGYFLASIANGEVTRRIGTGAALVGAGVMASISLVGYAVTPGWAFLLVAAVFLGVGGGLVDAGINAHVALHHSARAMGLLHASFGLGATLAPLVMTWLITTRADGWRWGFAVLAVVHMAVTGAFWVQRGRWGAPLTPVHRPQRNLDGLGPLLAAFVLIAGLESGAGTWAFTFLTEDLQIATGRAGLYVTGFFGCFTAGRVLMGVMGDRWSPRSYLVTGVGAALAGILLLWWSPGEWATAFGLALAGLGVAPLFPILVLITPSIVGPDRAHDVVGYELGAAVLGGAIVPAFIGVLVDTVGTGVIPVILAFVATAQLVVVPRQTPRTTNAGVVR
jgi:fucose permease